MIIVHHLNNSRSQRVLWLLEELGLEYEIKRYQRDPKTLLAPPELKAVHPLGKSPVVTDGELILAESGAILEYLVERYGNGKLMPARDTPEYLRYRYWMHFAEGSAMSPLLLKLVFSKVTQEAPLVVKPIVKVIAGKVNGLLVAPNITRHLDFMESELGRSKWFAGQALTAADIQMSFPVEASAVTGDLTASRPKLMEFLERIHERPAYKRAIKRGGPYDMKR